MSCPYAFIFGKPKQGPQSTLFLGFAVVDSVATVLLAILLAYMFDTDFWVTLLATFVVGEILHYIMGVQTQFLTTIGLSVYPCPAD
jgi:hypothetical protein